MNNVERKFIDLKALKVSEDGSGFIEGYRSVFGEIDEGGDIVVKGFFADGISDYLQSGFTAHSHDWSFKEAVGFPVDAKEDDHGFFVKSQFHSTDDAQAIRTKAKERMEAGKTVGFSFGYAITDKKFIESKDYKDQLAQYIAPERLAANLQKAQNFPRIRILLKGETFEDSLVTAPMQKLAMATGMKSENEIAQFVSTHDPEEIVNEINNGREDSEKYLKGIAEPESFESFFTQETGVEEFVAKMQRLHEVRVKEGRILSSANRAKVQAAYDALGALLTESEPKPKEKEIDVEALRTQSMRVQSLSSRALSAVQ